MKPHILKIQNKENLTASEMEGAMSAIMNGGASHEEMASFLLALREKGPSVEEITAAARIMRQFSLKVTSKHKILLDTCGTGGDKTGTFNISTVAAFVVAGAGVAVAKHGNRSVSSQCGSADVLEALGININLNNGQLGQCLDEVGIAFLFAQRLHPAMKNVAPVRKELGVETIFNLLGPLTNPANANFQMMGVYSQKYVEPLAHVLKNLGLQKALVFHGDDGLDEITTTGPTHISEFNGHKVVSYTLSPEDFKIKLAKPKDLKGGDLATNVSIAEEILKGKGGPKRDIVVFNAAHALYLTGETVTIEEGISLAEESTDSGRARKKLEQLKKFTQSCPPTS